MKRRDRGNAIEALVRKRACKYISYLKLNFRRFNMRKLCGTLAGDANHFRRQVKCQDMIATLGQSSGERTCAASDFQHVMTV
jgi:hypothetical protein